MASVPLASLSNPMKYALILALAVLPATLLAQASKSLIREDTMLAQVYLPILDPDHGWVSVMDVPVLLQGGPPQNFVAVMAAPVFANSPIKEERRIDLNLISLAKIDLRVEARASQGDFDFIVDLSKAEKLQGVPLELRDIVDHILVCLRLYVPPQVRTRLNIVITGVANHADWERFEGPLWVGVPE